MVYNKENMLPYLIYNKPFQYNESIAIYPVTMADVITFQFLSQSIILRKNSIFRKKEILKMAYLDFLLYCFDNKELEDEYGLDGLSQYFYYAVQLLGLCCKDAEIKINERDGGIYLNGFLITPQVFDDLRRIIIIQNDIDFDIDEFINYDTEQKLQQAQKNLTKGTKVNIEDYIDSLVIAINTTEDRIMNMTIRKFWRYIKRYQLHEGYTIAKTGECSGFVTFKEPIKHWIISLDDDDKYKDLKTDQRSLTKKIKG